jgi:putative FmdB family regulatory protein
VVGAEAGLARAAVDERVGEPGEVAAGLPHARVLEDRAVEGDDVVALGQHRPPPLVLDVRLEQPPVVAVVVRRSEPAVDLGAGEDEAAALAQRHDAVHGDVGGHRIYPSTCMPIYEYRRPDGTTFEILQKFSDPTLTEDPETGVPVERVFRAPAIHFKGSGFHNTDYGTRKRGKADSGGDGESKGSSSDGDGGGGGKSESKGSGSDSGSGSSSGGGSSDKSAA